MENRDDILVQLNDAEIARLADMYGYRKTELPHLHSFFQNYLKSKRLEGPADFVRVYSPRNCWQEDGTFIASMPRSGHDLVAHSFDKSGAKLFEGFKRTKRFDFRRKPNVRSTWFYALHEHFAPQTVDWLLKKELECKFDFNDEMKMWRLRKENALNFSTETPDGVHLKPLQPEDVPFIANRWSFRYPDCEGMFLDCMRLTDGYGVFLGSNRQPVSWVAASPLGQMLALQTAEEYRRKGLGSIAVKAMARNLAEAGFDPCATISVGNVPSERLMARLGFEAIFKCNYISFYTP